MHDAGPQSAIPLARTIILPRPDLAATLSAPDTYALERLSDTSQVQAWTKSKAAEYNNHISTLLVIYSSIAPVTALPVEILQEIFALVPCQEDWCDALWLLSLGLVCRRWHSVLLATSQYWARGIHAVMDPDFYARYRGDIESSDDSEPDTNEDDPDIARGRALFLDRSSPRPLEICFAYSTYGPDWKLFEGHFDRVSLFEVVADDEDDLYEILDTVKFCMKRLEKLRIEASPESPLLPSYRWEAKDLPRLRHLEITSALFCCETTVPSLQTVILRNYPRDMESLPQLFDALKNCPALATLRLELTNDSEDGTFQLSGTHNLYLPNLRNLAVSGEISDLHIFLSALSFPSTTFVELDVDNNEEEDYGGLVLPNILPRRPSMVQAHQMLHGIDRLCFYWNYGDPSRALSVENWHTTISMQGYVQGAQRLRVNPAFCFHSAGDFLQTLALFSECRVTELALDMNRIPTGVGGEFWTKFFAALPDLRRLELLSESIIDAYRATKRDIAAHYLALLREPPSHGSAPEPRNPDSVQIGDTRPIASPHRPPGPRTASLAWLLTADERDTSDLDAEFADVEQVLRDHVRSGARLERLELYVTTIQLQLRLRDTHAQALNVEQIETDKKASLLVKRDYVARLEDMVNVVVVGGGWEISGSDSEEGSDNESDDGGSDEERSDVDDDNASSEGRDESDLEN